MMKVTKQRCTLQKQIEEAEAKLQALRDRDAELEKQEREKLKEQRREWFSKVLRFLEPVLEKNLGTYFAETVKPEDFLKYVVFPQKSGGTADRNAKTAAPDEKVQEEHPNNTSQQEALERHNLEDGYEPWANRESAF